MTVFKNELSKFDHIIFFPSIDWHHSWERQQTLITAMAEGADANCTIVAPSGIKRYKFWDPGFYLKVYARAASFLKNPKTYPEKNESCNPLPSNAVLVNPITRYCAYPLLAWISLMLTSDLRRLWVRKQKVLVVASYVNPLVEFFLERATFTIIDIAEYRNGGDFLNRGDLYLEELWISKCDLFVSDNQITLDHHNGLRKENGLAKGHNIPQGVDVDEIQMVGVANAKIAVYVGNLHDAIDYELFGDLINNNPDWKFRVCGEVLCENALEFLESNVVDYVGHVSKDQLSEFMAGASIGLIPYLTNRWTWGVFPTKLFEYLAAGLKVYSTGIDEVLAFQGSCVDTSGTSYLTLPKDYTLPGKCRKIAEHHTWARRFDAYAGLILEADSSE